jgi:chemotaxis protein CheD
VNPVTNALAGTPRLRPDSDMGSVYLHSGQIHVSTAPCRVTTILGSCVAVGIFDPAAGVGGLNHFLLPRGNAATPSSAPRFGNLAVGQLVAAVVAAGGRREALRAKLFGGACVLAAFKKDKGQHLGSRNVAEAREALRAEGISVIAEDVDGNNGRKLIFQTHDGMAWVLSL